MPNCVECDEVITNPVCEECLAKQFGAWLYETDVVLEQRFSLERLKRHAINDVNCVLCGSPMDICPYCTSTQFISWLRHERVSPQVLGWALDFFFSRADRPHFPKLGGRGLRVTLMPNPHGMVKVPLSP